MPKWPWNINVMIRQLNRFTPEDDERCAAVVRQRYSPFGLSLIELPNRHPEPGSSFRIWASDVDAVRARHDWTRHELYGFLHTHPGYDRVDHHPSRRDYETVVTPGISSHYKAFLWFPAHRILTWYGWDRIYYQTHVPRRLA